MWTKKTMEEHLHKLLASVKHQSTSLNLSILVIWKRNSLKIEEKLSRPKLTNLMLEEQQLLINKVSKTSMIPAL